MGWSVARSRPARALPSWCLMALLALVSCGTGPTDSVYDVVGEWRTSFTLPSQIYVGKQLVTVDVFYSITIDFSPDNKFELNYSYTALGQTVTGMHEYGIYFVKDRRMTVIIFTQEPSGLIISGHLGSYSLEGGRLKLTGVFRSISPEFVRGGSE